MLTARRAVLGFAVIVMTLMMTSVAAGLAEAGNGQQIGRKDFKIDQTALGSQSGGSDGTVPCYADGVVIPCNDDQGGVWNGSCYVSLRADNPDDAVTTVAEGLNPSRLVNGMGGKPGQVDLWAAYAPDGHATKTGAIWQCRHLGGLITYFWAESSALPPSAAELEQAARLLVEGTITAPEIGTFPGNVDSDDTEITGIVGYPTWFWAKHPGPGVAAPETKTDSVRGYTLRATARLLDITYDTGDGGSELCHLGVEPVGNDRHEPAKPPDPPCGHTYAERGYFTITATTHVTVEWSGAGRAGSIPITVQRSGQFTVSEVQALIVPNRPG